MIDDFKDISIRGRLAFGAKCLENALLHFNIDKPLLNDLVLPRIWSFTTSTDLSVWEKNVNEIDPLSLLDTRLVVEPFDFSTITYDTFRQLKEVYESI